MTSFTVGTTDLRAALLAVAPHADKDPDFPPLHRIRFHAGDVNLTVSATQRYTAGLAIVSVEDNHDGEIGSTFDLAPSDVKELLALFRGKASNSDDDPGSTLRVDVDDKRARFTDTSGLFDGKALSLLRYPTESNFPDIAATISRAMNRPAVVPSGRLVAAGDKVGLFGAAAKAYGEPLVIEPTGDTAALLISCGESFLGLLTPHRVDDDVAARLREWRDAWTRRLPNSLEYAVSA